MSTQSRTFKFNYRCSSVFDSVITHHFFKLRALPMQTSSCVPLQMSLQVKADDYSCVVDETVDAFGNLLQYGEFLRPHQRFAYEASGEVLCRPYLCVGAGHPMYVLESPLVPLSGPLRDFAGECLTHFKAHWSNQRLALYLSAALNERMRYLPDATDCGTRADEAFVQGCGVCQDYAHILISLCRNCAVPARYAAGFLLGEGRTHAWVEIFEHGAWLGIDPTNNRAVDFGCVKTAHGRDASDCPVVRGSYRHFAKEVNTVSVMLQECGGSCAQQQA